jgi:hypothetical protein
LQGTLDSGWWHLAGFVGAYLLNISELCSLESDKAHYKQKTPLEAVSFEETFLSDLAIQLFVQVL